MSEEERRAEAERAWASIDEGFRVLAGLGRKMEKALIEAVENAARLRDEMKRLPDAE